MKFLIDKEINLNQDGHDLLKTKPYSDTLKKMILNSPDRSFTIGLFGEWGSGKSSIIKTTKENLEKQKDKKIKFIVYDAWKYANDSFRRMFLLQLQEELRFERTSLFNSFYTNKTSDIKIKRKADYKFILLTILIFIIGLFLISLINDKKQDLKITITLIISTLALLVNIIGRASSDYKVSVQEPLFFAPEQFEECFNEMMNKSLTRKTALKEILKWVDGENYESGFTKIVIVIDNIDRCHKELAYELLSNIKTFLGCNSNVIYLIPVDDDALKRHIMGIAKNNNHKEADEFLRKFFSVTLRIKPFKTFDLYDFASSLNDKNGFNLNPTTIDIISKEYASNPRRIIQFFNDLISELNLFSSLYQQEFVKNNESLICKILLLREEWPEYYKQISKNPSLLNTTASDEEMPEDLKSFLRVTDSINQNTSHLIIEKILSTYDRNSDVTYEVMQAINQKDFLALKSLLISQTISFKSLIKKLIELLSLAITRNSFATDASNLFEILCLLNEVEPLDYEENRRIYETIKDHLLEITTNVSDLDALCKYANFISSQYLNKYINNYVHISENEKEDEVKFLFKQKLFRCYIKNTNKPEYLSELKNSFYVNYTIGIGKIEDYNFNGTALKSLYSESLIVFITEKIKDFDVQDKYYIDLLFLSNNVIFSQNELKIILRKISDTYPNSVNIDNELIIQILDYITKLLVNQTPINDSETQDVLRNIYNAFIVNRSINGISRNIWDNLKTENEVEILIKFFVCVSKLSNRTINVEPNIHALIDNFTLDSQTLNNVLNKLRDIKEFSFTFLKPIVLNDTNFSKDILALLRLLLGLTENDNFIISNEELENKLNQLLLASLDDNNLVVEFLDSISSEDRVERISKKLVGALDKNQILKLSNRLQDFAYNQIQDVFEFETDINFLKCMADSKEDNAISKLVNLIIAKFQNQEKIDEALDILEEISFLSSTNFERINSNVEYFTNSDFKEKTKYILDKIQRKSITKGIQLLKVKYGSNHKWSNYTRYTRKRMSENSLQIIASNEIFGDPHRGVFKYLTIKYLDDNIEKLIEAREGDNLSI